MKQTVMTSVYGVTFVGAREQIKRRLQEKGQISDDRLLFKAASYAAKVRFYQQLGKNVKIAWDKVTTTYSVLNKSLTCCLCNEN